MSVTIQDILTLPALTGARLLTNTSGANRVVTSISVLNMPQLLSSAKLMTHSF